MITLRLTRLYGLCAVPLFLLYAMQCPAVELFVATDGNDANLGTQVSPFATIRCAQEAIRKLRYTGECPPEGVTVRVAGGRYELDEPLWFTSCDSGNEDAPVIYAAVEGEKVVLSGGRAITGWSEHEDGTWKAPAKGLFRQLYVQGKRAVRSRYPNGSNTFKRLLHWDRDKQTVTVPLDSVEAISDGEGAEFFAYPVWAQVILKIKAIERQNDNAVISFHQPASQILFSRPFPSLNDEQPFHLENHEGLLDEPGEWHHDTRAGIVYYKPRPGEDMSDAEVIVPHLESLLRIEGTPNRPVQHLIFRGFHFEHTNWLRPSHAGLLELQAGMYSLFASMDNCQIVGRPSAAIDVFAAQRLHFERNHFTNLGSFAIDLRHGVCDSRIEGNFFSELAGGAVCMGMFSPPDLDHHFVFQPDDEREICSNNIVRNNVIRRVALDYRGNCGIACGYVRGVRIEHNDISELTYSGVSVGWGWSYEDNAMRDNRVARNRLVGVPSLLGDAASIYTLSSQPGTELAFNLMVDITTSKSGGVTSGIGLDEGSSHISIHSNVFQNVHRTGYNEFTEHGNHYGPALLITDSLSDSPSEVREIAEQAGLEQEYQYLLVQ